MSLRGAIALGLFAIPCLMSRAEPPKVPVSNTPHGPLAWSLDEARQQLRLYPRDTYLQYVVMQLGLREGNDLSGDIAELTRRRGRSRDPEREVDLFSLFTAALAVQESLQIDSMRTAANATSADPGAASEKRPKLRELRDLLGPQVKSHPWQEMLAGRTPEVSSLSKCVPTDFYFAEFKSLSKLLDVVDSANLWSGRLASQSLGDAASFNASERVRNQLALRVDPLLRPFYDQVVAEVAVTGSDVFLREGSDVTLLFRLKQPQLFKARSEALLAEVQQATPGAQRRTGTIDGVEFVEVSSPDRHLSVFAADPSPDLHVRSNSKAALARVLAAMKDDGKDSLGRTAEFQYIRTLMPLGAAQEDGLVYLSDAFIRRLVGPVVKLTERRRVLCYNHLRMLAHARLLYQTDFGKSAASPDELYNAGCTPGRFGQGRLACPEGGVYSFSADGIPTCSVHGWADFMTPDFELPLKHVTREEAEQYHQFVESYNQYWRRYFDPIAVRIAVTPENCRFETIILPLIDNSIYTGLAQTLGGGGKPEPLESLPVPPRNIFSVNLRVNKEELLHEYDAATDNGRNNGFIKDVLGISSTELDARKFLAEGLGDQIGVHVYDANQMFGFDVPGFMGEMMGTFSGGGIGRRGFDTEITAIGALIASLNSPVYLAIPVKDAKVVDDFLAQLDRALAITARAPGEGGGFLSFDRDFYTIPGAAAGAPSARCHVLRLGPITWRFFWARIGNGFYIASKPFILEDLAKASADPAKQPADPDTIGHAMVRVRPEHWDRVLADFRLDWAENNRRACLDNLGPLGDAARAASTIGGAGGSPTDSARRLFGVHLFCPDGGQYAVAPDGKTVTCSIHGSATDPKQAPATAEAKPTLYGAAGLAATLTFMEDGLHAIVNVRRK